MKIVDKVGNTSYILEHAEKSGPTQWLKLTRYNPQKTAIYFPENMLFEFIEAGFRKRMHDMLDSMLDDQIKTLQRKKR